MTKIITETKLVVTLSAAFLAGHNFRVASAAAAEKARTNDPVAQRIAINDIKGGIIAATLKPTVTPCAELAAYVTRVLNDAKSRTEAERRAETNARTKVARLLADAGIVNLDKRGGSKNAKKRGTKNKAAPSKKTVTKKAAPKTVLATYVSPTITKADDWNNHVAFVTKNLGQTFIKAKPYLDKKSQAQYLKALSNFKSALAKIKA